MICSPDVAPQRTQRVHLEIRTLGQLSLELEGKLLTTDDWNGRKPRDLVLFLAANGKGVCRDTIIDALWDDTELRLPEQQFSTALSRARRALGGQRTLLRKNQFYTFGELSIIEDASLLLSTPKNAPRATICSALDLYQGRYLLGYYEDWVLARQSQIEDHLLQLATALLTERTEPELRQYATLALSVDETHEAAHAFLLRSHIANGEHRRAKEQYQKYTNAVLAVGANPRAQFADFLSN